MGTNVSLLLFVTFIVCLFVVLLMQDAEFSFHYSVKDEHDLAVDGTWDFDSDEFEPTRTVIILSADYVPSVMSKMEDLLPLPNSYT